MCSAAQFMVSRAAKKMAVEVSKKVLEMAARKIRRVAGSKILNGVKNITAKNKRRGALDAKLIAKSKAILQRLVSPEILTTDHWIWTDDCRSRPGSQAKWIGLEGLFNFSEKSYSWVDTDK